MLTKSARSFAASGAALSMAVTLVACSGSSSDANPDKPVTISITVTHDTDPYSIPWLVGMDQGFFEDGGVKVDKIVPGKGGATTLTNQLNGDLPIADTAFPAVVEASQSGVPLTIIGGAVQALTGTEFYTLAKNTDINKIEDIKKWAYTNEGSVTQALTFMLPEAEGLDPASSEHVAAGGLGEGIALMESGDVDAAVLPLSEYLGHKDTYKLVANSSKLIPHFQQTVITTTKEYAAEHPKVLKAVTAGYAKAVTYTHEHPDDAAAVYAKYANVDEQIAKEIVKLTVDGDYWGVGLNKEAIAGALKGMKFAGKDPSKTDLCDLFDPQYLPDGEPNQATDKCK